MKTKLTTNKSNPLIAQEITDLLKTCLSQNYFKFNGTCYKQTRGLAMGSPLSPLAAEVYMDHLERQHIMSERNPFFRRIKYYARFVDDTIICYEGKREEVDDLLVYLNQINANIKFTCEVEQDKSLNFLDLTISRQGNHLEFAIYRKSCMTDIAIHHKSFHHPQHKLSMFRFLINRLFETPMNEENYSRELAHIQHMAEVNGFRWDIIEKLMHRIERRALTGRSGGKISQTHPSWCVLPYLGVVSERIGRTLRSEGYQVSFKNRGNLRSLLSKVKDPVPMCDRSGVYRLECGVCGASYVGRTLRKLKIRCKEHLTRKDSLFFAHLQENKHFEGEHKVSLLHNESQWNLVEKLECFEIKLEASNPLNVNKKVEGEGVRLVGDNPLPFITSLRRQPSPVPITSLLG